MTAQSGTFGGVPGAKRDHSQPRDWLRRHAERVWQRQALRESSRVLLEAGPHSPQRTAEILANGLAKLIGGGCIIRGPIEQPGSPPLACAHTRAGSLDALRKTFEVSPHALAFACSAQATHTRQPILIPFVSSRVMHLWTQPAGWAYLDQCQMRSLLVAPARSRHRVDATILVWRERPCRPLTDVHRLFLDQVAQRVMPALVARSPGTSPARRL